MPRIEHIVVTTDLTPAARSAYPHAAALALAFDAPVTVLHVDDLSGLDYLRQLTGYVERVERAREEALEQAKRDFAQWGLQVATEVAHGEPAPTIAAHLEERPGGLGVIAKRGTGAIGSLLIGSTTKKLLRTSRRPVLVVPRPDNGSGNLPAEPARHHHLLLATDFSIASRRGLVAGAAWARELDLEVTVVHALPLPVVLPVLPGDIPFVSRQDSIKKVRPKYEQALAEEVAGAIGDGPRCHLAIGQSTPAALRDAAATFGVSLIALPSSGKQDLGSLLLGTTTERVLQGAQVPVLVLPPTYLEDYDVPTLSAGTGA